MPAKKCTKDGKSGTKWGDEGHCYVGPGGMEKALAQGKAIMISQGRIKVAPKKKGGK